MAEKKPMILRCLPSKAAPQSTPQLDHATCAGECLFSMSFTRMTLQNRHRHVAADALKARVHFRGGTAREGAGERVLRPELLARKEIGDRFANRQRVADHDPAPLQGGHEAGR